MHLLVVDDDPKFRKYIQAGLEESGIGCQVASDGQAALELIQEKAVGSFDLVLLDVMMPHESGWGVLKKLRQSGNDVPVIFVTARDAVEERVRGLELGADDYIIKPFVFSELLARIDAVLRRRHSVAPIVLGELSLDLARREVRLDGRSLDLSPREFDLLHFLARNHGNTHSRAEILRDVWGIDFDPETNIVEVHIGRLRKRLGARGTALIKTVRGQGYKLDCGTTE